MPLFHHDFVLMNIERRKRREKKKKGKKKDWDGTKDCVAARSFSCIHLLKNAEFNLQNGKSTCISYRQAFSVAEKQVINVLPWSQIADHVLEQLRIC